MHRHQNRVGTRRPNWPSPAGRVSTDTWYGWTSVGSRSGAGTTGAGSASCSVPARGSANDADMLKMTSPFWIATTRLAENDRPSRSRYTWKTVGLAALPLRRK